MEPILEIHNITKKYFLGGKKESNNTIGDALKNIFTKGRTRGNEFFALKDVSFSVNQGECVGIIGRNGAGKSTLLKIISRITSPTSGRIISRGRIASLLEVGTGFHPELSGRENIFLNGVILGMSRKEVLAKIDEIIDFSGVEKFIDTPLKHYSSGMQLRLAFAVAAYLEPEILIIDEVLAVGDAEFQKKCIGKMQDVTKNGRKVLFVSHNLAALQSLCSKSILLSDGTVKMMDTTQNVIKEYLLSDSSNSVFKREYSKGIMMTKIKSELSEREIKFLIEIISDDTKNISLDLRVKDQLKNPVGFGSLGAFNKADLLEIKKGTNEISLKFNVDHFANGSYYFSFDITNPDIEYYDRLEDVITLELLLDNSKNQMRRLEQSWNLGCTQIDLISK